MFMVKNIKVIIFFDLFLLFLFLNQAFLVNQLNLLFIIMELKQNLRINHQVFLVMYFIMQEEQLVNSFIHYRDSINIANFNIIIINDIIIIKLMVIIIILAIDEHTIVIKFKYY